jgi:hypothetical protein
MATPFIDSQGNTQVHVHDNTHAYTIEHDDFPEETRDNDFVSFAMPEYKEDRRDLFTGLHSALDFFTVACDVVTNRH